jgi:hypothetical protein
MELDPAMSVSDFESSYFYAADLKRVARELGITIGNARKHEIESLILEFLRTGRVPEHHPVKPRQAGRPRDVLTPATLVVNYVGDKRTKSLLLEIVRSWSPTIADKSGQWCWLNDWRRQQQAAGTKFTYEDLAARLRQLMETDGRLPQIPSARMNNFLTDFRADPANSDASRDEAMAAWQLLKASKGPKTFEHYKSLPRGCAGA